MQKKIILGVLLLTILSVLSIALVSSANTANLVSPADSSTITGSTKLNSSLTGWVFDPAINLVNITWYAKSASTANSTWALLNSSNSVNLSLINFTSVTFNSAGLEDSNDYIFNVTYKNETTDVVLASDTNTPVTVNNTAPTAPTLTPASNTLVTGATTQTFTGVITDAQTTSCTYTIGRNGATSGSDYSTGSGGGTGSSCTFTKSFTTSSDNGNWYWTMTASDGTDTTVSSSNILQVQITPNNGGLPGTPTGDTQDECINNGYMWSNGVCYMVSTTGTTQTDYSWIWWVAGFFIIVAIVYFIFKK